MDPSKYANMGGVRAHEESAPLLDLEQQPAPRFSEDTDPFNDDTLASDAASSKESRHDNEQSATALESQRPDPAQDAAESTSAQPSFVTAEAHAGGLPPPVTAWGRAPRADTVSHVLLIAPKFALSLVWFSLLCTWGSMSVFYLACWMLLQIFTGFTRTKTDSKMVRRDLGGFFNALMDMFESIW